MQKAAADQILSLLSGKQLRFIVAGLLNTLIDFTVFNIVLHVFDAKIWLANVCSTTIAMIISFAINKNIVFGDRKRFSHLQFTTFILITAIGLWGIQTLAIVGINSVLNILASGTAHASKDSTLIRWVIPNIAKGVATIISAIWNYFWYDRVIFAHKNVDLSEWM